MLMLIMLRQLRYVNDAQQDDDDDDVEIGDDGVEDECQRFLLIVRKNL